MDLRIRRVRAEEWPKVRELRLTALRDPQASIAFLEPHAQAAARPDDFWQGRAAGAASGASVAQFVAETPEGRWVGMATGLREEPGSEDVLGAAVDHLQVHVVGVYVEPDHRGSGLIRRLFDAVADWARDSGVDRLRLCVHVDNGRARAAYERLGFDDTGRRIEATVGTEIEMVRDIRAG